MPYWVLFIFYISHSPDFFFLLIHDIALQFISRYFQSSWDYSKTTLSDECWSIGRNLEAGCCNLT